MVFSIGSEFVENKNNTKFVIRKIKTYKRMKNIKYKRKENNESQNNLVNAHSTQLRFDR